MVKLYYRLTIFAMNNIIPITDRTKQFAIRIIKAYAWLKKQNDECEIIGKQLLRSSTSVGAMTREAQSAQSDRDFLNKLMVANKEIRESQYWLELLIESELVPKLKFQSLLDEANEIGRILTSSTQKIKNKITNY